MSHPALNVTPSAIEKFKTVINEGEHYAPENALVRVMIKGRTATEYEYTMGLTEKDENPAEHMRDSFYEFGDVKVVVDDVSMKSLKGSTIDYKEDLNAAGFVIDNPNKPIFNDMERDVQELLNQQINPQIKSHGGQVDVVRYEEDDSVLCIEMSGGCQGCSSSSATLKNGVETMIYYEFPDIGDIRDVTDHESGENPYYER